MAEEKLSPGKLLKLTLPRFGGAVIMLGMLFFLPAWTLNYWQAWVYLGVLIIPMIAVLIYLLKKDPELLERRMRTREREKEQRMIITLSLLAFLVAFILPGFDHRLGWSHVPTWLVIVADLMVLTGYAVFVLVIRENRYASRVVEVEEGQKVISTGPYGIVRHPMYFGTNLLYLFSPIALGSFWALIPLLFVLATIIMRILNEEVVLARDLPGYTEYMQKVRYRLIPGIW